MKNKILLRWYLDIFEFFLHTDINMYEDGIVHDVIRDKFSGQYFHLELHCIPCYVQGNDSEERKTRSWLTRSHLNRVLTILSPIVTNHLIEEVEEANEDSNRIQDPQNAEIIEDEDIRLAVVFCPDTWSRHRMKIVRSKEDDSPELDESFCDIDNDELTWRLDGCSSGKDRNVRLSNNRILAVVAINDPNVSCLERANISHSIYEIINKYTSSNDQCDNKNKKTLKKYFPKRSKRKQATS